MATFVPPKAGKNKIPKKAPGRDNIPIKGALGTKGKESNTPKYGLREVKNKKLPEKKGPNKSGGGGGGKGLPGGSGLEKTARRLTNSVIRDEVQDLQGQRRQVNRAARHANLEVRNQYRRGAGDLDYVHGETADYIGSQNAIADSQFNVAGAEQAAASAALQSQLQNVYDAGEGSATAEMARLGITGPTGQAAGGFLGQLAADSANAQATGAINSTNNAANLSAMQANSGAVGNLLAGMNQGSYMSGIGQNLNAKNTSLNENREEQGDQLALVREAIMEAQGSRKDTFFQLLTQLKQSGWAKGGGGGGGKSKPREQSKSSEPTKKTPSKSKSAPAKTKK
jgi:hypothetical protein